MVTQSLALMAAFMAFGLGLISVNPFEPAGALYWEALLPSRELLILSFLFLTDLSWELNLEKHFNFLRNVSALTNELIT